MSQHWVRRAIVVAAIASFHATAHAQAWVPDKGSLGVSLDYNLSVSDKVVTDSKLEYPDAGTTGHQITLGVEYVPVEKLAVSASLPLSILKYTGSDIYPHDGGGRYDDGSYHSTLTDLRAGVRYQLLDEPFAIAPHIGFTLPVADYETVGNTVAGRHLKMAHLGLNVGTIIGVASYVHLSYEFTLAEKYDRTSTESADEGTRTNSQNRSDASFTLGTKVLDYKLDLHLGANVRIAHGGINFSEFENRELSDNEFLFHDAILEEDIYLVGAGIGYDVSDTFTVTLDYRYFIEALSENTQNASVLAVGLGWSPL